MSSLGALDLSYSRFAIFDSSSLWHHFLGMVNQAWEIAGLVFSLISFTGSLSLLIYLRFPVDCGRVFGALRWPTSGVNFSVPWRKRTSSRYIDSYAADSLVGLESLATSRSRAAGAGGDEPDAANISIFSKVWRPRRSSRLTWNFALTGPMAISQNRCRSSSDPTPAGSPVKPLDVACKAHDRGVQTQTPTRALEVAPSTRKTIYP